MSLRPDRQRRDQAVCPAGLSIASLRGTGDNRSMVLDSFCRLGIFHFVVPSVLSFRHTLRSSSKNIPAYRGKSGRNCGVRLYQRLDFRERSIGKAKKGKKM